MNIIKMTIISIAFFANMVLADAMADDIKTLERLITEVEALDVNDLKEMSFPNKIAYIHGRVSQINRNAFGPADTLIGKIINEMTQQGKDLRTAALNLSEREYENARITLNAVKSAITNGMEKLESENYFVSARKTVKVKLIRLQEKLISLIDDMLAIANK